MPIGTIEPVVNHAVFVRRCLAARVCVFHMPTREADITRRLTPHAKRLFVLNLPRRLIIDAHRRAAGYAYRRWRRAVLPPPGLVSVQALDEHLFDRRHALLDSG